MPKLSMSYERVYGRSPKVQSGTSIKIRRTLRVIKPSGEVRERCSECSGFAFKFGKGIRPAFADKERFQHKKGCSLA